MKSSMRRVKLTHREVEYLKTVDFLPRALLEFLQDILWRPHVEGPFEVPAVTAEEIRDALTERLAKVGFDQAYEPTAEGVILEDLIDRFRANHDV